MRFLRLEGTIKSSSTPLRMFLPRTTGDEKIKKPYETISHGVRPLRELPEARKEKKTETWSGGHS